MKGKVPEWYKLTFSTSKYSRIQISESKKKKHTRQIFEQATKVCTWAYGLHVVSTI